MHVHACICLQMQCTAYKANLNSSRNFKMVKPLTETNLFKSVPLGAHSLPHRLVFAPSTRMRASDQHVPSDLMLEQYSQRSKNNGGLIITEATFVSEQGGLYDHVPGIWSQEQVEGWKKITDRVHENGSKMCIQLWSLGRVGKPSLLKKRGKPYLAPSAIYPDEDLKKEAEDCDNLLRPFSLEEIEIHKQEYVQAAKNAIAAGFDYVEIHSAHGYTLDQFLQSVSNHRTDKYGGSIENRARLVLEIVDLLIPIVGASKLAIRLSPYAKFQAMSGSEGTPHPIVQMGYVLSELEKRASDGNRLAYVSLVEPRVSGILDVPEEYLKQRMNSNDFAYQIWKGNIIRAGQYLTDGEDGYPRIQKDVDSNDRTLIAASRYYTSNPDLVHRLKAGLKLTPYDRQNFYAQHNYHYGTFKEFGQKDDVTLESAEGQRMPVALA